MNKTVVIFESKYGFTRRYAQWVAEALSCPVFERKKIAPQKLDNYDTIIYGGGLYAGGVSGIKFITQNWKYLHTKNVFLFTCGLADPASPINVPHIREALARVLTPEMLQKLQVHTRNISDALFIFYRF